MKKFSIFKVLAGILGLVFIGILPGGVLADGNEILGSPAGITIESGSRILAAGTGLITQPGTIDIAIPLGVTIKQVLLYWQGIRNPDNTISVEGTTITGSLIGTGYVDRYCYRADITVGGFVVPGPNSLSVSGLTFDVNNGAGVLVIIDDDFDSAEIDLRDGDDFAYAPSAPPWDTTVAQTFFFTPEDVGRAATLSMFFASVSGTASGGGFRPTAIEVTVGGATTVYNDLLDSVDGIEWDTVRLSVDIPAHISSLTVQALSVDNPGGQSGNPASFDWIAAALSVPPHSGGEGCTPGYWKQKHHFDSWVNFGPNDLFSDVFGPTIKIKAGKKRRKVTDPTLLQALKAKGGGINALARHTVAALLNAASPDASYDLFVAEVIDEFNEVYPGTKKDYNSLKDFFVSFNEQGCPLN